ncbi:hypothetical protein GUJ93_ZPchr0004g40443 [Zizania palustris]|uniref:Uncharacterized protein n=1 Tax=Zizania palustris TaxID=103762 RepID=A0A8J5RZU7_ZIZPA|nr:hypothetical protein GUJ93_ZPchr0004g40443 [Zizania palustris]
MTSIMMAPRRKVVQPPQKEVAPENKSSAHRPRQDLAAAPLSDYEKLRAKQIMKNNQVIPFPDLMMITTWILKPNDNIDITTEGDSIPRPDEDNQMDTEGEEQRERGVNMGHGL